MKRHRVLGLLIGVGMLTGAACAERLDPEVVDRDFKVTVTHAGPGAFGNFSVVGNFHLGLVRVPVLKGNEVVQVVEVGAPTYTRNSSTVLRPAVEVRILDVSRTEAGESGPVPLVVLECQRAIDWNKPGTIDLLYGDQVRITLEIEAVEEAEDAAGGEAVEEAE